MWDRFHYSQSECNIHHRRAKKFKRKCRKPAARITVPRTKFWAIDWYFCPGPNVSVLLPVISPLPSLPWYLYISVLRCLSPSSSLSLSVSLSIWISLYLFLSLAISLSCSLHLYLTLPFSSSFYLCLFLLHTPPLSSPLSITIRAFLCYLSFSSPP